MGRAQALSLLPRCPSTAFFIRRFSCVLYPARVSIPNKEPRSSRAVEASPCPACGAQRVRPASAGLPLLRPGTGPAPARNRTRHIRFPRRPGPEEGRYERGQAQAHQVLGRGEIPHPGGVQPPQGHPHPQERPLPQHAGPAARVGGDRGRRQRAEPGGAAHGRGDPQEVAQHGAGRAPGAGRRQAPAAPPAAPGAALPSHLRPLQQSRPSARPVLRAARGRPRAAAARPPSGPLPRPRGAAAARSGEQAAAEPRTGRPPGRPAAGRSSRTSAWQPRAAPRQVPAEPRAGVAVPRGHGESRIAGNGQPRAPGTPARERWHSGLRGAVSEAEAAAHRDPGAAEGDPATAEGEDRAGKGEAPPGNPEAAQGVGHVRGCRVMPGTPCCSAGDMEHCGACRVLTQGLLGAAVHGAE